MNILHINTNDSGGAATACRRIHLGLLKQGIDSKILLLDKTKDIIETYKFEPERKRPSCLKRLYNKFYNKLTYKYEKLKQEDLENRKMV